MEKYKFIVKLGQIKDLIAKGQDEKAIELAGTVDFKKVKNIEDLGSIAALFLKNGMLLKARECYLELYDRVANRNTVMQLINLALRLKRPNEAEKYLREYQKIDKNDFYALIFRYNIDKLEGKPYKELIPTLEKLKKKEYIEAWAYELAKLYHKSGDVDKCIAECDDLIVFFGEGEYVERAKALKDYYEKDGGREAREREKAEKEAEEKAKKEELAEENARAVEEAFAKADAIDPDVTELKADEPATKEPEPEADEASAEVTEFTAEESGAEVTEFTAEESVAEVMELKADAPEEPAEEALKAEPAQQKKQIKLDKDDLLLMQLLREEGIEQPTEPIIEEDMVLEEEEAALEEESAAAEQTEYTAEEPVAEEVAVEEPAEESTVAEEEPVAEAAVAEAAAAEETEESTVVEEEPVAEVTGAEEAEEYIAAEEQTEEIPAEERPLTYEFSEEGLAEIPARSRLDLFLKKNDCKLDDLFGYMAYINDIRVQIIKALELILNPQIINAGIAVTGADRGDMINIIKGIAKAESKSGLISDASCALAPAEKINKMDLDSKVSKLVGRCLVIEGAGALDANAVESILRISEKYGRKLGIILADSRSAVMSLLRDHRELNSVLPVRIHIPVVDDKDVYEMVRYSVMKSGYTVTASCEQEILAAVKSLKAAPANKYAQAQRFIKAVIDMADKRMTENYLEATADGRRISGNSAIELEDIRAVKP